MRKKINEKAGSVLAWLLAMTMIISLMPMMALTTSAAVKYNNGTFEGSGRGFGGDNEKGTNGKFERMYHRRYIPNVCRSALSSAPKDTPGVSAVPSNHGDNINATYRRRNRKSAQIVRIS